jgi:hypothetical protein
MERKHEDKMKKSQLSDMRIEFHHNPAGKLTGHTVHHTMMAKPSKSGAFSEHEHASFPFSVSDHAGMLAHVNEHLGGGGLEAPNPQDDDGSV